MRFARLPSGDNTVQRRLALIVLAFCTCASIVAWSATYGDVEAHARVRFATDTLRTELAIRDRLSIYENSLRGAQGLVASNNAVTREQWRTYVDALALQERFPGIQGIGWTVRATAGELAQLVARVRAEGFPNFKVWPEQPRLEYHAIVYLEPFKDRNLRAFGYDMFTEPTRRRAMEHARDTGEPGVSARVTLVQETDVDRQKGFLMYLPVYRQGAPRDSVEQRRSALLGFAYAPFRIGDLVRGILGQEGPPVRFRIYDGAGTSPETLLYDERPDLADGYRPRFSSARTFPFWAHRWTLAYDSLPQFDERIDDTRPFLVLAAGLMGSLLLSGVVWSWAMTRARARWLETIADEHARLFHEARQAQRELQALTEELERRVAERTTQLEESNRKLTVEVAERRQAEEAARKTAAELERSNRDLEQFAYVASHDLQEPLRMVASYVELLGKRFEHHTDEDARAFIGFAVDGARRMQALIRDLLAYSRAGAPAGPREAVPAQEALDEALRDLRATIEETGAEISTTSLPEVRVNPRELQQVFQNLIGNSLKFRRPSVRPRVRIEAERRGGDWLFTLTDNGIGFDPQYAERIFRVFQRLHGQPEYPGTGIGLSICKKIVESHGGRIWAKGSPGEGSKFQFTIPA